MIRSGVIGAGIGLVYVMSLTLVSPFCTICLTPLLGMGVGYLANWFDKPPNSQVGVKKGIIAGAITGVGVIIGQMMAAFVNAVLVVNSEELAELMSEMGFSQFVITDSAEYWQTTFAVNSFCGIFNLFLIIGLSAVGSMVWFRKREKNSLAAISA